MKLRYVSSDDGIIKQSMRARNRVERNRVIVPARQATKACGIDSLESIPTVLKRFKIRALDVISIF